MRPSTGALKMPVVTDWACQVTSRGSPVLSDMSFTSVQRPCVCASFDAARIIIAAPATLVQNRRSFGSRVRLAAVRVILRGQAMESRSMTTQNTYVLGSDQPELARLDRQAAMYESATVLLLKSAGIAPGMRVLDLGTG